MSTSERAIPHLRDIFSISGYTNHHIHHHNNNLHYNNQQQQQAQVADVGPDIINSKKTTNKKKRDNSKTLTSGDVKTLERHLSMKKTIRKKIMRDLQQAFVEDPNEFKTENITPEQLKAEIRAEAVRFGEKPTRKSDNFLDMLRGENNNINSNKSNNLDYISNTIAPNHDYDYDSPVQTTQNEKQSFWKRFTMKSKNKR